MAEDTLLAALKKKPGLELVGAGEGGATRTGLSVGDKVGNKVGNKVGDQV